MNDISSLVISKSNIWSDYDILANTSYYKKMCMIGKGNGAIRRPLDAIDEIYNNSELVILSNFGMIGHKKFGEEPIGLVNTSLSDNRYFRLSPDKIIKSWCILSTPFKKSDISIDLYSDTQELYFDEIDGDKAFALMLLRKGLKLYNTDKDYKSIQLSNIILMYITYIANPYLINTFYNFIIEKLGGKCIQVNTFDDIRIGYNKLCRHISKFNIEKSTGPVSQLSYDRYAQAYTRYIFTQIDVNFDTSKDEYMQKLNKLLVQSDGKIIPITLDKSLISAKPLLTDNNRFLINAENLSEERSLIDLIKSFGIVSNVRNSIRLHPSSNELKNILSIIYKLLQ